MRKIIFLFLIFITCMCFSQSIYNSQQIGQTGRNQNVSRGFWVKSDTFLTTAAVWIPASGGAGKVFTSDANGFGTWQSITSNAWGLTGNSGTNAATNFIGTTDAVDFVLRANNTARLKLKSWGNFTLHGYAPNDTISADGRLVLQTFTGNLIINSASGLTLNAPVGTTTQNGNSYIGTFTGNHSSSIAGNQSNTVTGSYTNTVTGNTFIKTLFPSYSEFITERTYNDDVFRYGFDNVQGSQLMASSIYHYKNGNTYMSMGVEEDTAFTGTYHAYIIVADTSDPNANSYYSQTRDRFSFLKNNSTELFAVDTNGLIHYAELDSVTIYALSPSLNATTYCTDCSGNGITGRILSYIGSAWRRLLFE